MQNTPSTEERIWAVLSHLSALGFGMGILLPIFGWSGQREKSSYASFQSLQALGYQTLGYTIWILVTLVIVVVQSLKTISDLVDAAETGADFGQLTSLAMGGHFGVTLVLIVVYIFPPILGMIACAMGRDFRYPILGKKLADYIQYDMRSNDGRVAEHEDRFVAAMGHFAVIIVLWGLLAPFVTWVLQGKRSLYLRIQAIQTLVYQIFTTLLFFGAGFVSLVGVFVFLGSLSLSPDVEINETTIIGLAVFGLSMLCVVGIMFVVPLLHILGQWAGFRILKGVDYRYPIVGRFVERRIGQQAL